MSRTTFRSILRDYFTFNTRERRGALVLAAIILIQICWLVYDHYFRLPSTQFLEEAHLEIIAFESAQEEKASEETSGTANNSDKKQLKLAEFDPNTADDSVWSNLGLSSKQIEVIEKYKAKGGLFRSSDDLKKIFVITEAQFALMEPYIRITSVPASQFGDYLKRERPTLLVNINVADSSELVQLPGIGPRRAQMICRYREALGGFVHTNQLLEVYSIDSVLMNRLANKIYTDGRVLRRININSDSLYHPYLNKSLARNIIAYRKQHGSFRSDTAIRNLALFTEKDWERLVPYVVFE
jgi:competence protein ComEA